MDLNEIKTIEDADEYIDLLFTEYEIGIIHRKEVLKSLHNYTIFIILESKKQYERRNTFYTRK